MKSETEVSWIRTRQKIKFNNPYNINIVSTSFVDNIKLMKQSCSPDASNINDLKVAKWILEYQRKQQITYKLHRNKHLQARRE